MSFRAMEAVWELSEATGGALLVLLSLADHYNDERGCAWPSVRRIAQRARLSPRHVKRLLRELEDSGEIEILRKRRRTNVYRIPLLEDMGDNTSPSAKPQEVDVRDVTRGVTPVSPQRDAHVTPDGDAGVTRTGIRTITEQLCEPIPYGRASRGKIEVAEEKFIPATCVETDGHREPERPATGEEVNEIMAAFHAGFPLESGVLQGPIKEVCSNGQPGDRGS